MKKLSTIYHGSRVGSRSPVTVDGVRLAYPDRQTVVKPLGLVFDWGHQGEGPQLLAFAILLDFTGEERLASDHYRQFKFHTVGKKQHDGFMISGYEIRQFLEAQGAWGLGEAEE